MIEQGGYAVKAADTTGAGDAFVAAMLIGILRNRGDWRAQLPEILDFANAVGAMTCLQKGAIPSLPTMSQARAFQADHTAAARLEDPEEERSAGWEGACHL